MMLSLLIFYSLVSYIFSGSVCYLVVKANHTKAKRLAARRERLVASVFWPLWLMHCARQ
ncbi:MAG: hypothetical protein F6J87_19590 [Spirulina sp. SIO3F2]|nr:hypothetical protein [Spirulina sp. SIO3F2]